VHDNFTYVANFYGFYYGSDRLYKFVIVENCKNYALYRISDRFKLNQVNIIHVEVFLH